MRNLNVSNFAVALLSTVAVACSGASIKTDKAPGAGPFNAENSKFQKAEKLLVANASQDFEAVRSGKKPIHAKFRSDVALPTDGGTVYYRGDGYEITVLMSLASVGSVDGYFYGPILKFNSKLVHGNSDTISNVQFYTLEALRELGAIPQ